MASNYPSINVTVFPTTYRTKFLSGKYTSEQNFVNILNSITDYNSYVLDYRNSVLKVVIHGYYFEIGNQNSLPANLWLGIIIESGESNSNALVAFDTKSSTDIDLNNEFKALVYETDKEDDPFTADPGENYRIYSLHVTDRNNNIINKRRFKSDAITYEDRQAGVITVGEALDRKQNNLIVKGESGLELDANTSELKINDTNLNRLNNLNNKGTPSGGVGNRKQKLFYFNENGVAINSTENIGYLWKNETIGNINTYSSQPVYVLNGDITGGQVTYASINSPNNNIGKDGDIWFKYS